MEPGEALGREQLLGMAPAATRDDVEHLLIPKMIRADVEIGWVAKVVSTATARKAGAESQQEAERVKALQALQRGTALFLRWHRHLHPDFGSGFYKTIHALNADLMRPKLDALTIPNPPTHTPPVRRGPRDIGWAEAATELRSRGVSRETQRLIRRLFAL
jgi:hypothetical protein